VAALTFSTLQTEVYDQTGLDGTDTNNQTRVSRWLNYVQQDICARWPWNFLRSRESVVTVPDYTTGTVSVNSGSATVTGVGTTFTSTHGSGQYYLQFAGANDWYQVTTYNSATSLTISPVYTPTTNLSGATYTLRKFFYSLSSNCDRICDVKNWNTPLKLDEMFPRDVDFVQPNPQSTKTSYGFIPYGYDSSNNVQIIPYPFPSDARLFEIKTFKRPTDMVNSSDLPTLPNKWAHIIAFGATAVGFAYRQQFDKAALWEKKFEAKIEDMMSQERTSEDSSPILQSIDSGSGSTENWLQFPDTYPSVPGRP
jgi:hypothetical protein